MAAAGSYLLCQLRESKLQNGQDKSLIEKGSSEKKKMRAGAFKTTDKLTIASLEWRRWGVEE
jgi:hypothetical protein